MAEGSDLEKTEAASSRRIEQAREDGQVPQSRELQSFLLLMAGVLALWVSSQWMYQHVGQLMRDGLMVDRQQAFNPQAMEQVFTRLGGEGLLAIAPLLAVLMVAAVAGPLAMGGINFSTKAFELNPGRMNPLNGIKRMFSLNGLVELFKSTLKAALVGGVAAWLLWHNRDDLLGLLAMPLESGLAQFGHMLLVACLTLVMGLAVIAGIDVPYQLWQYYHGLRMTKEEVKRENKESEGDPKVKSRIRARQREMARRRMMESVPKADVVVTNPTHYAVALKYDAARMGAPTVVAKGADLVAEVIRELAAEHHVPLLEAPPLARALFRHAEVGQQVPAALYTAVAEVMAYVYQLNNFLSQGGLPPLAPADLPVPAGMDPASAVS